MSKTTLATKGTLTTFDRCHDRDDPDGILVVLETTATPAREYEYCEGITVADVHDDYPRDDCVIVCAYERSLDRHCPDWREAGPPARLRDVVPDLHYYPESKLELYTAGNFTQREDGCVCEHCETQLPSASDWVRHVVGSCNIS